LVPIKKSSSLVPSISSANTLKETSDGMKKPENTAIMKIDIAFF